MVGADDIGLPVVIRAAGDFFRFVDGWRGHLDGFESGLCRVVIEAEECGERVSKLFFVPPEEVEALP